jgi:hypothetical protein
VKEEDVDDDGTEQGEGERDVAIEQEQDRRNELEEEDGDQIVGDKERPDKLPGDARRHLRREKVEEAVESKDEKDEAEEITSDDRSDFHVSIFCLISIYFSSRNYFL